MHELPLTGLYASNPLGALAAFGLLRTLSEIAELADAKLAWRETDDWQAVLCTQAGLSRERLVEILVKRQEELDLSFVSWGEDIRVQSEEFRERLKKHAESATLGNRELADRFAAYGSELATDEKKGLVKPTAFHMTSGQQRFLKILAELGGTMRRDSKSALEEALFGPWLYADKQHSLGWDPNTERMAALRYVAPTDEKPNSVRGAVWLAAEALPLFPTAAVESPHSVRLETTGFSRRGGEWSFLWPVWSTPIALPSLKSLLAAPWLQAENLERSGLVQRGVVAAFQSVVTRFGKGYGIFRPATLVFKAG